MVIYLIEDDSVYAKFIQKTLGRNAAYKITWFSSAEACLPVAQKTVPDVMIIDYKLPGMSGLELYQALLPQLKEENKCIVMSSIDDGNMVLSFIKQGVRDYVIKDQNVIDSLVAILEGNEDEYYLFN
ncbi:MAG: response regulator [Chryseolinea sp.]